MRKDSEIIFIRHGESKYLGEGFDLTKNGENQIEETARQLKEHLALFDCIWVVSSPSARAISSSEVFLNETSLRKTDIHISYPIRPFEIKDLPAFLAYDKANATPIYGQMWLTNEFLKDENPLVESRHEVNKRSFRFLSHYSDLIQRVSKEKQISIAMLTFTHFEVGINFLSGLYPDFKNFPITTEPALKNGEAIILKIDDTENQAYTVNARGKSVEVKYDKDQQTFNTRE